MPMKSTYPFQMKRKKYVYKFPALLKIKTLKVSSGTVFNFAVERFV
jgi:hypothetical protein